MKPTSPDAAKGVGFGLAAYTLWGCFPIYFALFEGVPSYEVLVHRIVWSCVFLAIVVSFLGRWKPVMCSRRAWGISSRPW